MSESEIIRVESEALMKFCNGNRELIIRIIHKHGSQLRDYVEMRYPHRVTVDELCAFLEVMSRQELVQV